MAQEILIVDDEPDIRMLIEGVLSDEGYSVRQAGDADAAVARISSLYREGAEAMRRAHGVISAGGPVELPANAGAACYPFAGISVGSASAVLKVCRRKVSGAAPASTGNSCTSISAAVQ